MITTMHTLNPLLGGRKRAIEKLCAGQALLCRSLGLTVPTWDQKQFCDIFYIKDVGYIPKTILLAKRRGIPKGRDEDLLYRFIMSTH